MGRARKNIMSHNIHSYTSRRSTIEDVPGLGAVTKGFGCDISVENTFHQRMKLRDN
jgi:hypothetical protein